VESIHPRVRARSFSHPVTARETNSGPERPPELGGSGCTCARSVTPGITPPYLEIEIRVCATPCAGTWCYNRSARVHPDETIDRLGIRYDPEGRWMEPPSCRRIKKPRTTSDNVPAIGTRSRTARPRIAPARSPPSRSNRSLRCAGFAAHRESGVCGDRAACVT